MTHPELHARIEASFVRQGMMQHLGARIVCVAPGEVEIALPYSERVTQQQGGYHGGAMGALADIAAGYAGPARRGGTGEPCAQLDGQEPFGAR